MKCVCPMGGDRTCPADCPLAVWQGLSPSDRKRQRKAVAERLYKQGFTMEAIATQLGVVVQTISNDLANFPINGKSKSSKTASNPKGAGRPKGSIKPRKAPEVEAKHDRIVALSDKGMSTGEVASEVGVGQRMVSRVLEVEHARREAKVDTSTLSLTAQEKLDIAIRQYKRKLDMEFERRVQEEYQSRLNEWLPDYHRKLADAEAVIKARPGFMPRRDYRKIWACLHPDGGASKELLEEAFKIFAKLEFVLVKEEEMPTSTTVFPRTYSEMMELRRKTSDARRARRSNRQGITLRCSE